MHFNRVMYIFQGSGLDGSSLTLECTPWYGLISVLLFWNLKFLFLICMHLMTIVYINICMYVYLVRSILIRSIVFAYALV